MGPVKRAKLTGTADQRPFKKAHLSGRGILIVVVGRSHCRRGKLSLGPLEFFVGRTEAKQNLAVAEANSQKWADCAGLYP